MVLKNIYSQRFKILRTFVWSQEILLSFDFVCLVYNPHSAHFSSYNCRIYIYVYLLIPWGRVLLEKLTGSAAS